LMRKLIEAAMVAVILAIGVGLFISSIYQVRQTAKLASCRNNLKQLGLAVINYCDFNGSFPTGTIRNPNFPPDKHLSWLVSIGPYIESGKPLLTLDKAWDDPVNRKLWVVAMLEPKFLLGDWAAFFCPSNPNRGSPDLPSVTHYVGVAGIGENAATFEL